MTGSATPTHGIVLGYGSIGRRHAAALSRVVPELAIVNRRAEVRERASAAHPKAHVVERLEDLDGDFPWSDAAAVIATWGPSHAEIFDALADRGVRRILCEKPMAASVNDARRMAERAERDGLFVGMNHTIRYARLAAGLRELFARHDLGEPVSLVVDGGAACLLTNGIHWIDFAIELFGSAPERVVSTASGEAINPRSPDLMLYGGTALWSFGGGREAVISFNNGSSVFPYARIYLRDGVAELRYTDAGDDTVMRVTLRRRDMEAVRKFPKVTRTGAAVETLHDGPLPAVRTFNEGMLDAARELVEGIGSTPTCSVWDGVESVGACIGALVASRDGCSVRLPIEAGSRLASERWPIS